MKKLTLLITILALLVSAGATFAQDEAQPNRPNPDRIRERVCGCVDESLAAMADDLGISMEELEAALATLPAREARILRLRFGLQNGQTYSLSEVGEKFGLTRERIRQLEKQALRRLRHPRRSRQLREYLS